MQVLSEGQRLNHGQYGMGEVIASDSERTSIEFDDHGTKLFVTGLMKAELVGEAPPKRTKVRRRRKAKVTPAKVTIAAPDPTPPRRAVTAQAATQRGSARRRTSR